MKILFVNTRYYPNHYGGAEETVKVLAEGLAKLGHTVTVASLSRNNAESRATLNGVTCVYLPVTKSFWLQDTGKYRIFFRVLRHILDLYNPLMGFRFAKLLRELEPDVVAIHNIKGFSPSIWRASQTTGVPISQMLHDYYLFCGNSTMYRKGRVCEGVCLHCRAAKFPTRLLARLPKIFIANSSYTQGCAVRAGLLPDSTKGAVINPAICVPEKATRRKAKSEGDGFVFGFLGRIDQTKGVDILLKAFREVDSPKARLLIGGEGYKEYVDILKSEYADARIGYLGRVEPRAFFTQIDALVVPSQWNEPFGRVIVEAYSYGVPVIASDMGGMSELVSAETGALFKRDDVGQLTEILQTFAENETAREAYFEACRRRSEDFEESKVVLAYESELRKICGQQMEVVGELVTA